jgi:two-component system response regulator HydG
MATVLVTDDDVESLEAARSAIRAAGHMVLGVGSSREALAEIARTPIDVLLADVAMRDMSGLELCDHVVGNRPDVPVIVTTARGSLDVAIAAIRAGAYDFLLKPIAPAALLVAIDRAAQHRALLHHLNLVARVESTPELDGVIGESPAMQRVLDIVRRVADTDASLLIGGASGTGKEIIARALHRNSRRRDGPFVSVNCAALPEALLESELFGHTRGAFTDARQAHGGLFQQAQGGTFFLDEIGDMPLGLQPKLLRALQERTIRPVGSSTEIPIDVRIDAATNQDLETSVEEKRFRSDLFFRVNVVHVTLPPQRQRGTDIILLAQYFLQRLAARDGKPVRTLSPAAAEKLLAYDWPGNVRELQNCMDRAVALGRFDAIGPEDLPDKVRQHSPSVLSLPTDDPAALLTLRELERRYVARVLAMVDGNKTTAARLLGIDRKTLYRKLEWLDVDAERP